MKSQQTCTPCFFGGLANQALHQQEQQPARPRACAFYRVSTLEQAQEGRNGLLRQKEAVTRVIQSKQYELVHSVELVDVSGSAVRFAPETIDLVARIARGDITVLVASEFSRLLRPDDLDFSILEVCQRYGVIVDCGGTGHDLRSPEGFIASTILSALGGAEKMELKRKMMSAKEQARAAGRNPQSHITLPTGITYERKDHRWGYNPDIAMIVEAFRIVDEEGVRNLSEVARRTSLHPGNVRNLLSNTIYKGIRSYTKMRSPEPRTTADGRQADRRKVARPLERIIKRRVFEPGDEAVDPARFDRVQEVLASIREFHEVFVDTRVTGSTLGGPGRCGVCADRLYARTTRRTLSDGRQVTGYYTCATHHIRPKAEKCGFGWVPKEALDSLASSFVERFLEDAGFVSEVLSFAQSKQSNIVGFSLEGASKDKLDDLARRDARVLAAVEAGVMGIDEAKQARARIAEQKKAVLASLDRSVPEAGDDELRGIAGRIAKGVEEWRRLTRPRDRKAFISAMFSEIYFRRDEITAFRLAPALVGSSSGAWSFAAKMPVVLPEPFRITPKEPEVAEGMRRCTRCNEVREAHHYYKDRPACRECLRAACRARYEKSKASKQSVSGGG